MTIFANYGAKHPFDGDYILRVVDVKGKKSFKVLYYVDRSTNVITVVAVQAQKFMPM